VIDANSTFAKPIRIVPFFSHVHQPPKRNLNFDTPTICSSSNSLLRGAPESTSGRLFRVDFYTPFSCSWFPIGLLHPRKFHNTNTSSPAADHPTMQRPPTVHPEQKCSKKKECNNEALKCARKDLQTHRT